MKPNTGISRGAGIGLFIVILSITGISRAADDPLSALAQRGDQLKPRIEAMADANPRGEARARFNAFRMCLQSAQEVMRTHVPGFEGLAPLAGAQLDQVDSLIAGKTKGEAAVLAVEASPFVVLANQDAAMLFTVTDDGADLRGIYHAGKDFQFIRWVVGRRPLWAVRYFKDGEWPKAINSTIPTAVTHAIAHDANGATLTLGWKFAKPYQTTMNMSVRLPANSGLSEWSLAVDHQDSPVGLGQVEFPIVRGVGLEDDSGTDFLAVPQKNGWLYYNPGRNASFGEIANMQYECYYTKDNAGLYFAADDPEGNRKEFMGLADSGTTALAVSTMVPGMGKTPIQLSFNGVVGPYTGDWYDGSLIYRQWALKQKWVPKQNYLERDDLPQWYKEHSLCIRAAGDPKTELPRVRKIKERLGANIPAVVQWYGLFGDPAVKPSGQDLEKFPNVNGYPGLKEAVAEMNKIGAYVAEAYHEPMLWAEDSDTYKPMNGEAAAIRDMTGAITYARFFNFPLTCCCPSQPQTQQVMIDATLKMVRDYGVKGIYGDLCGTYGSMCFAPNHGHPLGGGNWHPEGQRTMLKRIRAEARKLDPNFTILVENMDERMLDSFDSYIAFHGINPEFQTNIPMVYVVYGEYTLSGASKSAGKQQPPLEESALAQVFVWGDVIGRYWSSLIDDAGGDVDTAHWLKLARYHHAGVKWFIGGRMLRPLALKYEPTPAPSEQETLENRFAVQQASHKATDGSVLFAFCNSRINADKTISYTIDPPEYQVPADGSWTLYQMTDDSGKLTAIGPIGGKLERRETLPPRGVLMLVAKPSGDKS